MDQVLGYSISSFTRMGLLVWASGRWTGAASEPGRTPEYPGADETRRQPGLRPGRDRRRSAGRCRNAGLARRRDAAGQRAGLPRCRRAAADAARHGFPHRVDDQTGHRRRRDGIAPGRQAVVDRSGREVAAGALRHAGADRSARPARQNSACPPAHHGRGSDDAPQRAGVRVLGAADHWVRHTASCRCARIRTAG